jgi:hypothetical protein
MTHISPDHALPSCFFKFRFNIILPSTRGCFSCSTTFRLSYQNSIFIYFIPHACHMFRPSIFFFFDLITEYYFIMTAKTQVVAMELSKSYGFLLHRLKSSATYARRPSMFFWQWERPCLTPIQNMWNRPTSCAYSNLHVFVSDCDTKHSGANLFGSVASLVMLFLRRSR